MRPKRLILCVGNDEEKLGRRAFLLATNGYLVLQATTCETAVEMLAGRAENQVAMVIVEVPMPAFSSEVLQRAVQLHPEIRTIVTSETLRFCAAFESHAFLPKGCCSPAELLDRMRILLARKRGPKTASSTRTAERRVA